MNNKKYIGGGELLKAFKKYLSDEDTLELALSLKISKAIIEQRKAIGISQSELAKRLGVKQPVVSKWESGDANYTIRSVVEIFSALKLDFELLIGSEVQNYRIVDIWKKLPMDYNNSDIRLLAEGV